MYVHVHIRRIPAYFLVSTSLFSIFRISNRVVLWSFGGSLILFFKFYLSLCVCAQIIVCVFAYHTCIEKERKACEEIFEVVFYVQSKLARNVRFSSLRSSALITGVCMCVCACQHSRLAVQICLFFVGMGMVERWSNVA